MDTTLMIVTLAALGLTASVLLYLARTLRDERSRSEARVRALAEELRAGSGPAGPAAAFPEPVHEIQRSVRPAAHQTRGATSIEPSRPAMEESPARAPYQASSQTALFAGHDAAEPAPLLRRLLGPLVGIAVVGLVVAAVFVAARTDAPEAPAVAAGAAPVAAAGPVELVSLQHERKGETMVVSGRVRNPSDAALTGLSAVITVFDAAGVSIATGEAGIDYPVLSPGEESPFVVSLPNAASVSKYRVSFRNDTAAIPHVDRRPS